MSSTKLTGGCDCGAVRYALSDEPLFVHCCHCRWCQRESGASFALNALIETGRLNLLQGDPESIATPSGSGRGQEILRCPACRIALWSHYAGAGDMLSFVRVGTLDDPDRFKPDVHIFVESRQPWFTLPPGTPAFEKYYDARELWPKTSLARLKAARAAR